MAEPISKIAASIEREWVDGRADLVAAYVEGCPCAACDTIARSRAAEWEWPLMILCPTCGNKRCPRATHHDNACTGSNEPGQKGSAYE